MAALHPFFVHFPIALLLAAVLFDGYAVLRDHQFSRTTAFSLQIMAALSAILAAISGNQAEAAIVAQNELSKGVAETFNTHVSLGNLMVWIIVAVAVGRTFAIREKKNWSTSGWVFPMLSLGLGILVLVTGLLGGQLSREILQYFIQN